MDNFLQQLINGLTLGSIYGLIAIGYTMVFGIIGMVNFAHGDVFMLSAFIALLIFMILTQILASGLAADRLRRRADRGHGADRPVELGDRAARLPAVARIVPARAADLGDRHVDLPVEFRPGRAGAAQQAGAATAQSRLQPERRRLQRHAVGAPDPHHRRHGGAAGGLLVSRAEDLARARAARLRAGPQDGGAARHRRRRDDLDHLRHRRGARGGRGRDVRDLLWRGELRRRLRARRQGLHGGGARRHRLVAGRGARRPPDRPDRGVLVVLFHDRLQGRRRLHDPGDHARSSCPPAFSAGPKSRRSEHDAPLRKPPTSRSAGASADQLVPALRTAAAAALVAFGLCFPDHQLPGRSRTSTTNSCSSSRWPLSFAIAAIVFAVRLPAPDGAGRLARLVRPYRRGAVGGMGGALAESAREGEGAAPPSRAPGASRR